MKRIVGQRGSVQKRSSRAQMVKQQARKIEDLKFLSEIIKGPC